MQFELVPFLCFFDRLECLTPNVLFIFARFPDDTPDDTCGFLLLGQNPESERFCPSRVVFQILGLIRGPGFPTVFLENFPMFGGFLRAKCFPKVKVRAQGGKKKKIKSGDRPIPRGRTLATEHCKYA